MKTKKQLLEKWDKALSKPVEGAPEIKDERKKVIVAQMLENYTNAQLDETTKSADVDKWDPILIPMIRRVTPDLIAYDTIGVQPMKGPTGLIFAMKAHYAGDSQASGTLTPSNSLILTLSSAAAAQELDLTTIAVGDKLVDSTNAFDVTVIAIHEDVTATTGKFLVQVTTGTTANFAATTLVSIGAAGASNYTVGADTLIDASDTNEALFDTYFRNYSGSVSTATAEDLSTNMKEMGFTIDKSSVTAKVRNLKARYSLEVAEDMQALHGADAETELMNILSYEIMGELNREIVSEINTAAAAGGTYTFTASSSDGRYSLEKFYNLYTVICKAANDIALSTRRGRGNFVIASSDVITALEACNMMNDYQSVSAISGQGAVAFAGTLKNGMKVYRDTFALSNYATVGYKGATPYDAGIYYCPFIPMQALKTRGEEDFQPRIGFRTRYGIGYNPYGQKNYYRKISCNFGTMLTTGASS